MTQQINTYRILFRNFNPHLPQEMTLAPKKVAEGTWTFQSTSPAGDDSISAASAAVPELFQSTSPAGDDSRYSVRSMTRWKHFNPHLPQEMTRSGKNSEGITYKFQSTSPAGDDSYALPRYMIAFQNFNPHLPQEMTQRKSKNILTNGLFQSTSPAGDDSAIFPNLPPQLPSHP